MSVAALLGRLRIDFEVHTGKLQAGMNQANRSLDGMSKKLIGLQNIALGVAGAAGFGQLIGGMINVTNLSKGWTASLEAATGSLSGAKAEMAFVTSEADRLGIGIKGAADQYSKLANAARGTALEGAGVRDIFSATMEAARVFNLTADDSTGAMRALAQMISKSTVSMEEMRQQFSERIPGAMQAAARAMGMTVQEFSKAVSVGDILAKDLLPKLAVELRALAAAGLETARNNPAASFQRLSNAITKLGIAIGNSGVIDFFAWIADNATTVINGLIGFGKGIAGLFEETTKLNAGIEELSRKGITTLTDDLEDAGKDVVILQKELEKLKNSDVFKGDQSLRALAIEGLEAAISKSIQRIVELSKETKDLVANDDMGEWLGALEPQIDSFIQDILSSKAAVQTQAKAIEENTSTIFGWVEATKSASLEFGELYSQVDETGNVIIRANSVVEDSVTVHEQASISIFKHATAMQVLSAASREAAGIMGNVAGSLSAFGLNIPQAGQIASQFSAVSNLSGLFGSTAFSGGLADLLAAGGRTDFFASSATNNLVRGGFNTAAGNLRGANDLGLAASGLAGGVAANQVFGDSGYTSTGSAFGGVAGALAGSFFGNPYLGAAAGSFLGGGIGSLFGGEDKPKIHFQGFGSGAFPGEGDGRFGQNSFLSTTPFGRVSVGGRDGARLPPEMFGFLEGIREMDEVIAQVLTSGQIASVGTGLLGMGGTETRADNFSQLELQFQRAEVIFESAGGKVLELFEKFGTTAQTLSTFVGSLEAITNLSSDAQEVAAGFGLASDNFQNLVDILRGFESFASGTFGDLKDTLEFLNQTPMEAFDSATEALHEAMAAFDGTEQATLQLNTALGAFSKTEIALMQDLDRLRDATGSSIGRTEDQIRQIGMTGLEIFREGKATAQSALADIRVMQANAADPQEIAAAAQEALLAYTQGFNKLTREQQLKEKEGFLGFLSELDIATQGAFLTAEERIQNIHEEAAETMTRAMLQAAAQLRSAASALKSAANKNRDVNVQVSLPLDTLDFSRVLEVNA